MNKFTLRDLVSLVYDQGMMYDDTDIDMDKEKEKIINEYTKRISLIQQLRINEKDLFEWINNWIKQLIQRGINNTSKITKDDIMDLVSSYARSSIIPNKKKLTATKFWLNDKKAMAVINKYKKEEKNESKRVTRSNRKKQKRLS